MSDISELERRISAALERIGAGMEALSVPAVADAPAPVATGDDAEVAGLKEELDAERAANQQLEERVRVIRERQETTVAGLEKEVSRLRDEMTGFSVALQKVKRVNAQLRENNRALREANLSGSPDPHLINKSMLAELDALRTSRENDRIELDALLGELKPLVAAEGGADA